MSVGPYYAPARDVVALSAIAIAFVLLAVRAVQLQISDTESLQREGAARFLRDQQVTANRGIIRDRNGIVLAVSTPVDSVWAEPNQLRRQPESWTELEATIGLKPNTIATRLGKLDPDRQFMYLKRALAADHAAEVMDLGVGGVALLREYRRYYPFGSSVANLIGFTNIDDRGLEGVELAYDDRLTGQNGIRQVIMDRKGRVVETVGDVRRVEDGDDVTLSIDSRIQQIVHQTLTTTVVEHKALSASAVVVNIKTGEILAITTVPSFNPNDSEQLHTTHNYAARHEFEPGSVVKPFVVAKALLDGAVLADTIIRTSPGVIRVDGFQVQDYRDYGDLSIAQVIQKSSNVGAIKIGRRLAPETLANFYTDLGFRGYTGSGIVGETYGSFPQRSNWRESEHATLSYGYGFSVSMLQIVRAYAMIANGGRMTPLTILAGDRSDESVFVMPRSVAREMTEMLELVVAQEGTASRAKIPSYRVAGKTSTAQKLIDGVYRNDRHRSTFVGFVPASDPQLAAMVMVDEPTAGHYFGGRVAAPAFRQFMAEALRILKVPPDDLKNFAKREIESNQEAEA